MPSNVLVTGGAGFIGSHLVDRLLRDGHTVTALDNFDAFYDVGRKWANIAPQLLHSRYTLVEADIRDIRTLRERLSTYDIVVHLAAKAGVRPSIDDPMSYQEVNVAGTQHLLELCRERGIGQFVFASSSSVYGVNPHVPWNEHDHVLLPISPYASTKISGELLGHTYSHLFGIRFVALRFFTVYGPRQRPDLAIHKFARLMLKRQAIPFYGDGSTQRDYTYVDDIVGGIVSAMNYTETPYEVMNLGNDRTVSLLELTETLEKVLHVRAKLTRMPDQPGDVPVTWANIEKAARLLGYSPRTSLADGLAKFASWLDSDELMRQDIISYGATSMPTLPTARTGAVSAR